MSVYYRRTTPGARENLGAGMAAFGVAAGVAAVTFYLTRLFLAREPFSPSPPKPAPGRKSEAPIRETSELRGD